MKRSFKSICALVLVLCMITGLVPGIPVLAQQAETYPQAIWDSFKTPAADKKPAPLWFWNRQVEDMTTDQVREIVRESYLQTGFNGFGILPEWQDEYFSERYFELYEAALDEGSKYGMRFSIYDENGFPSYNAGGLLEEKYPDLTTKRLDKYEKDAKNGEKVSIDLPQGKLMGAVAMNMDTNERIDITDQVVIAQPKPFDPATEPVGVSASSTYTVSPGYGPEMGVDGNLSTRWNSQSFSGGNQYLQIKFAEPTTFDQVKVYEDALASLHRTQEYMIQYWDYDTASWVNLATGKKITNLGVDHAFTPVTSDLVRLFIKRLNGDSASISEFQVFSNGMKLSVPPSVALDSPGVSGSSRYNENYDAKYAFDDNPSTRWNPADSTPTPHWIQMNFGEIKTVDNVKIYESMNRITGYQVQYWSNNAWVTCASGTTIGGGGVHLTFAPVETQKIRLYITNTNDYNPSIWEFEVYNGEEKLKPISSDKPEHDGSYLEYTALQGNWKVMVFMCVVDGNSGMDYLDPASVKAFIDITYEEYYKRFKKYFDNGTIKSAFFDEPSFWPAGGRTAYGAQGARFWTPGFNEEYAKYYDDSNPVLDYPALWYSIGDETDQARNRLQEVRTEMFANNYIGQMNEWCKNHGIELTGHMLWEEWVNPVGLHGDLMKVFKNQAIPGVDVINRFGYTQEAYKIIASSAYNWDKGRVMSESFGVFPSSNCTDFYKSAMDQFAKGINLIIPHAVWYDDDPQYVTYVPELSYRNPQFKDDLPALNDYIGRLSTLLQNGKHVADIAMLYPIDYLESSFIFNGQANDPSDADYMKVSETLSLSARRDFTYLHPDIINERCTVDGDTFKLNNVINSEQYKVFIMPGTKVISLSNLKKIKAFYDNGGKVIATTQLPSRATTNGDNAQVVSIISEMFGVDSTAAADAYNSNANGGKAYFIKSGYETKLTGILDQALSVYDVTIDSVPALTGGHLSYIHKIQENSDIYFFANSSNTPVHTWVNLRGKISPTIWNPHDGTKAIPEYSWIQEDGQDVTRVKLDLNTVTSLFIMDESVIDQTTSIAVSVDKNELYMGDIIDLTGIHAAAQISLQATLTSGDIIDLNSSAVTFESSDSSIATVDENGVVRGVSDGTVTVTATMDKNGTPLTSSVTVSVSSVTVDKIILSANRKYIRVNEKISLETSVKLSDGKIFTIPDQTLVTYQNDNAADIAISNTGIVSRRTSSNQISYANVSASLRIGETPYVSRPMKLHVIPQKNVALAANGATITASSTNGNGYRSQNVINGDRTGAGWGNSGGWNDATSNQYPDWVEITFAGNKSINHVDVITLQDNYQSPAEPTSDMTFTTYGVTEFEIQYWNGSAWTAIPGASVTQNNKVWNQFDFAPIATDKIRVYITNASGYSRLVAVEAWENYELPTVESAVIQSAGGDPVSAVVVNTDFSAVITTTDNVTGIKLLNENEMNIGKKEIKKVNNDDGTITWTITMGLGTAGADRILSIYTQVDGSYSDSGERITFDISDVDPDIISVSAPKTAVKNDPFTITVVTSKTLNKIKLTNESGSSIGILTQSCVQSGNEKTWTLTAQLGTAGATPRTIDVLGAAKDGVYTDYEKSFVITITK